LNGCHPNTERRNPFAEKCSPQERAWLTKFFRDLLLNEAAIYTLWGSKPMTLIHLILYTQEEIMAYYNSLSDEQKKEAVIHRDYDLDENWKKWEKIKDRFPKNRFLLFQRDCSEGGKIGNIYLVDVLQTALVIQENYASFQNVVGFDFDPIKIVYEIQDPDSVFWNKTLQHSALLGILFGFGPKNAWAFQWKYGHTPCLGNFQSTASDLNSFGQATLSNFPLPVFSVFNDWEVVERYKKEREGIQKNYKGKDFVDLTLQRLSE